MPQDKMEVSFSELRSAAQQMDAKASEYRALYLKLFDTARSLQELGGWQGGDSKDFYRQLEGMQNDFSMMENNIRTYVTYLRKAADAMETGQKHFTERAKKLDSGK